MNELIETIKKNNFIIPDYTKPNIVDLVRSIYYKYNMDVSVNENVNIFNKQIPNNKHIILIISDGTGSNLIDKLDNNSILKNNKIMDMITVFPSTTACVLTSLVTAEFPITHGIWGWYNYDRKLNLEYYPLLYSDRKNNCSLFDYGIKSDQIYKQPSLLNSLNTKVNVLFPKSINDSVYSNFVINKENRYSYNNYDDIVNFVKLNCEHEQNSFTYLYMPDIDSLEHENGIDSKKVMNKLTEIDEMIKKLALNKDLTIIFTADHGQTNVNKDIILDFEYYKDIFYANPTIDFGTASYFVKKEYYQMFENDFNNKYKNDMFLFKTSEFIKNNFLGLGSINDESINNLGEYISIPKKGVCLVNSLNSKEYLGKIKGNHSGLSDDEMIIPLVIIDTNKIV